MVSTIWVLRGNVEDLSPQEGPALSARFLLRREVSSLPQQQVFSLISDLGRVVSEEFSICRAKSATSSNWSVFALCFLSNCFKQDVTACPRARALLVEPAGFSVSACYSILSLDKGTALSFLFIFLNYLTNIIYPGNLEAGGKQSLQYRKGKISKVNITFYDQYCFLFSPQFYWCKIDKIVNYLKCIISWWFYICIYCKRLPPIY